MAEQSSSIHLVLPYIISPSSSRFQPGEGPSRGLLRDYEPSDVIRMQLFEALAGTLHHRLLCLLMIHSINDDEPCVQTVTARPATTRTRGLRSTTLRSPGCRSRSTSWPPATRRSPARCTTAAPAPPTPAASPPTCSHPRNLTTPDLNTDNPTIMSRVCKDAA